MIFHTRVSRSENESLLVPFTYDDFELAVKQMHPDKAPGSAGLNPSFYHKFWPVLGQDIFHACIVWLEKLEFSANLNDTLLTLCPKCDSPTTMCDLRPIALCNVLYKIIAKVLAKRLKRILPNIISLTQSAFVPGRSILDNVIVAFEVLHSMKRKVKCKTGEVALKIDISKAFDTVTWTFLHYVLVVMDFDRK